MDARPTPLRDVAHDVSLLVGLGGTILTSLVGYGILTVAEGDAITGLLGLIPGFVTGISAVIAAFRTARQGEALVTPLSSPMNNAKEQLVPAALSGRHERLADQEGTL